MAEVLSSMQSTFLQLLSSQSRPISGFGHYSLIVCVSDGALAMKRICVFLKSVSFSLVLLLLKVLNEVSPQGLLLNIFGSL